MTGSVFTLRDVVAGQRAGTWDAAEICAEAAAFFARLGTQPSNADKAIYNRFIMRLVASPVWNKLDALYVFGGPIQATSLMNLRQAAYDATVVASVAFTAYRGFNATNGTGRISSNFTPSTAGGNYQLNNACVFAYLDNGGGFGTWSIGCNGTADKLGLFHRDTVDRRFMTFNCAALITKYSLDGGGLVAMDRSDSGGWYNYQNGAKVPYNLEPMYVAAASTALPSTPIDFMGGASSVHGAIAGFGGSLTDDDHKTLNSACEQIARDFGFYHEPNATALSAANLRRKPLVVPYSAVAPKAVETWPVLHNGQLLAVSFDWGYSFVNPHIVVRRYPADNTTDAGTIIADNVWTGGGFYGFADVFDGVIHIFGSVNGTRNIVHATLDPTTYAPSAPVVIATADPAYGPPTNLSVVQDATGYALSSEDYGATSVIEFFHSAALDSGWASIGTYVPPNYYGQSFLRYDATAGIYYLIYGANASAGAIGYDAIVKTTSLTGGGTWDSPTATRQVLWPLISEGTNSQIVGMINDGKGNVEALYTDTDQAGKYNVRRAQIRDISVNDLCASYFV